MNPLRQAVIAAGFQIDVNQAGPLLEQMARRGEVRVNSLDGESCVAWQGQFAYAPSVLEAAMRCIARTLGGSKEE